MNCLLHYVIVLAVVLTMPVACLGGGLLHVFPPQFGTQKFAIARPVVVSSQTTITVSDSFLECVTNQTFLNDNELPVKGLYILPFDSSRRIEDLEVRIDGVSVKPRELGSSKSLLKLEELTRRMRDPSLLSFAGMRLFVIEPVTMSVNGKRTITVKYAEPISLYQDRLQVRIRTDGERHSMAPVKEMEVRIRFKMSRPVSTVLSLSHHMKVVREAPHRCTCIIKKRRSKIREDVRLLAFFSEGRLGVHVLTHKPVGRTGTFMAVITPPTTGSKEIVQGRDVVLILDSSGSMGKKNHSMAKEIISACIRRLRPLDRFNVINVTTRTEHLAERLIQATDANLLRAVRFLELKEPGGGTDLYNALVKALLLFNRRKRVGIVLVAADGRATVGITNPRKIVNDLAGLNTYKARIFALAFGRDAEVPVLSKLTEQTGGKLTYVQSQEGVSDVLNHFLAQFSLPHASKLSLEFRGVEPLEMIPNPIPDIFRGETRVVLGRYTTRKDLEGTVTLRAGSGGSIRTIVRPVMFPRENPEYSFLPAIWAMRKLGTLLEQKELEKKNQTLKRKIQSLTSRFGFCYPLIQRLREPQNHGSRPPTNVGALIWTLKTSLVTSDIESPMCRRVNGKVFCREGSRWVDREFRSSMHFSTLTFLSKDYFQKLETDPELGAYFALGSDVTVVHNGTAIVVRLQ